MILVPSNQSHKKKRTNRYGRPLQKGGILESLMK